MCLTVMTFDNSKHCHLKQILISLELLRYQGLTVFTPGVSDKGKFKESLYLYMERQTRQKYKGFLLTIRNLLLTIRNLC